MELVFRFYGAFFWINSTEFGGSYGRVAAKCGRATEGREREKTERKKQLREKVIQLCCAIFANREKKKHKPMPNIKRIADMVIFATTGNANRLKWISESGLKMTPQLSRRYGWLYFSIKLRSTSIRAAFVCECVSVCCATHFAYFLWSPAPMNENEIYSVTTWERFCRIKETWYRFIGMPFV